MKTKYVDKKIEQEACRRFFEGVNSNPNILISEVFEFIDLVKAFFLFKKNNSKYLLQYKQGREENALQNIVQWCKG